MKAIDDAIEMLSKHQERHITAYDPKEGKVRKFPLAPMGVLAPCLRTLDGSALPPIDMSRNLPASPSEVITEVSEP